MKREPGELKQLSNRRKKDQLGISLVAASEREEAQIQLNEVTKYLRRRSFWKGTP
jgi:hypothetical protein